jgi:SAM-dependent methyltransferase
VFHGVLKHLEIAPEALRGLRVLELGPGDKVGALELMLTHGAKEAVALDRFAVDVGSPVVPFVQVGIEDAADLLGFRRFDLIYSVAVLEHVADLSAAFESMYRLLAPGGMMAHQIGGGDHGIFTAGGHHPLTYMTIPAPVWSAMTAHSGGPNRVVLPQVRRLARRYDWEWTLAPTDTINADVEAIRPRLRGPFRNLPASELITEGSFLTCRARPLRK